MVYDGTIDLGTNAAGISHAAIRTPADTTNRIPVSIKLRRGHCFGHSFFVRVAAHIAVSSRCFSAINDLSPWYYNAVTARSSSPAKSSRRATCSGETRLVRLITATQTIITAISLNSAPEKGTISAIVRPAPVKLVMTAALAAYNKRYKNYSHHICNFICFYIFNIIKPPDGGSLAALTYF